MLTCLALKKLFDSLGASEQEYSQLVYHTVINLRESQRTGKDSFEHKVMGLITGGLLTRPDVATIEKIAKNQDKYKELFWPMVKQCSQTMHERLINDPTRYFVKIKPAAKDEINFHFTVSNVGVMPRRPLKYFEILDAASLCTLERDINGRLFCNYFATAQSLHGDSMTLWCGLFYNSHYLDTFIVERYVEIFNSELKELVKNEPLKSNL